MGGYILYFITFILILVQPSWQYCYSNKIEKFTTWDTANYGFSLELDENQIFTATAVVRREVEIPLWHIVLLKHIIPVRGRPTVLFDATHKRCEFVGFLQRRGLLKKLPDFFSTSKSGGNATMECPMKKGTYVTLNAHIPPDMILLRIAYAPKSMFNLIVDIISELPDKTQDKIGGFNINSSIVKRC